ncbi:hypothetical protein CTheo_8916 [Ceratobasidium theobromae]|uniref:Uncharacterized protein n=1 Tax=Ceratobasidium theobromae TaxID=1582974 RepID=A0A5N5Q7D6_9AGAM|nr:hypothetical protein CTheo_8916 [Ceratobasidium theobromae]
MLRMHQEREAIMRIRARIDAASDTDEDLSPDNHTSWKGPRVQFGSPDRNGKILATKFVHQHIQIDPGAQEMELHLRTFLYQCVGGFGSRKHFRKKDLPLLDGMVVSVYNLITVSYVSMLDSQDGLDIIRVTDSWRNQGPRHDYVLAQNENSDELFVARILKVFRLKARGEWYSIAYIHPYKIGRRNKSTGYINLIDTKTRNFMFSESIIRSCVVLSPNGHDSPGSEHVLWDLEGPDMYIRLQDI